MRNLKRVLSLALASVMLFGMMVVGSSAAFKDADKIVNAEAVGIAGGLGLFAGDTEGNFNPEGTVTRAQMAAVIAKMFYGSELNADTYKGGNKFTDTANFEGGWAEGYINLGVEKGWFKGYGDGTFKPGQAVTTAEAMTMIINLLGIDAGEGTWPMTVMAAVEEASLFNDEVELKPAPATNAPMTRDQLSVAVVNGLYYSAEGVKGYTYKDGTIVFKTWADAHEYASKKDGSSYDVKDIKEVKGDTLKDTVFAVVEIEGVITGNQATGLDYTAVTTSTGTTKLDLETGIDMLGHNVKAYFAKEGEYQTEKKRGTAYSVVDTAEYFTVKSDIKDKKAYTDVFGGKIEEQKNTAGATQVKEYRYDGTYVGTLAEAAYDEVNYIAKAGTYGVDKETGKIVTYITPEAFTIGQVGFVKTVAGKETIQLSGVTYSNNADLDVVVEYEGVAEDDIVVIKEYQWNPTLKEGKIYIEKLEPVQGTIDGTFTDDLNGYDKDFVTIGEKSYLVGPSTGVVDGTAGLVITATSGYTAHTTNVFNAYIYNDTLFGTEPVSGAGNLEDAIFIVKTYTSNVDTAYGTPVPHYYAQGINAQGEEVTVLIGIDQVDDTTDSYPAWTDTTFSRSYLNTFVTFEKSLDRDQAKKDIMTAKAAETGDSVTATNGFYSQAAIRPSSNELKKDDKYLTFATTSLNAADGRLYLTADTKFVVVEKPGTNVDELEIATYTGAIAKKLAQYLDTDNDQTADTWFYDDIYVAGVEDTTGAKTADIVVIATKKLNLAVEDYVYVATDASYTIGADVVNYKNLYFTKDGEFKAVSVAGTTRKTNGFYVIDEIDEDGVYHLSPATDLSDLANAEAFTGVKAAGVYGNNLIFDNANQDMYALAEDAKIYDVRSAKDLEKSEVGEITTLKGIAAAIKGSAPYIVKFDVLMDEVDSGVFEITHIFVKLVSKDGINQI